MRSQKGEGDVTIANGQRRVICEVVAHDRRNCDTRTLLKLAITIETPSARHSIFDIKPPLEHPLQPRQRLFVEEARLNHGDVVVRSGPKLRQQGQADRLGGGVGVGEGGIEGLEVGDERSEVVDSLEVFDFGLGGGAGGVSRACQRQRPCGRRGSVSSPAFIDGIARRE